jgi:hypothetical protein
MFDKEQIEKKIAEAKAFGIDLSNPAALIAFLRGDIGSAIAASNPDIIEVRQRIGIAELIRQEKLPKDILNHNREVIEGLGFAFGPDIDGLFVAATLPKGWSKVSTKHDMWINLLDEKNRIRAGIFFKEAFYDSSSSVRWSTRFRCTIAAEDGRRFQDFNDDIVPTVGVVMDCGVEIYRTKPENLAMTENNVSSQLVAKAHEWLTDRYPKADNVFEHWDD